MDKEIPKAVHEGVTEILGVKLRTYRLDNGQNIINAEDLHKLLEVMARGYPVEKS